MSFSWFGQSYIFLSRLYLITSTPFILFGFFQGMTVKNKCLQNERTVVVVVYKRLLILPMIFSTIASQRRYTYFFLILFMRCKTKLWLIRFKIKSNKSVCEILSQFRSLFWTQLFGAQVNGAFELSLICTYTWTLVQYATLKIERQQLQEYLDTLLANILERDPR